jgi:type II secretory pathway pseudopilin PulG
LRRNGIEFFRTPLTVLVLPTFANAARSAAYTQARLDFARLACALERYRRANGSLPSSLDALAPGWIDRVPRDVVGGGRYVYANKPAGIYSLYGKGWNARDDGGSEAGGSVLLGPSTENDWVWAAPSPMP